MEKPIRFRKAFYEKENELHQHNKNKPMRAKPSTLVSSYQSLPVTTHLPPPPLSLTQAYLQQYGSHLHEASKYQLKPPKFLNNHEIDGMLRARMLDWMMEVTTSYKFTHKAYFDGVQLMDRYFAGEKERLPAGKLHLVGVVSMLLASKMEEVYPLKMKTVYEKIGHCKLPMHELVATQARMMQILNYKLNSWSFFDIAMLKLTKLLGQEQQRPIMGEMVFKQLEVSIVGKATRLKEAEGIASYLSKMALLDYNFYCESTILLLAETVVSATVDVMRVQVGQGWQESPPIMVEVCKERLLGICRQLRTRYSGLINFRRFTSEEVVAAVELLY